MELEGERTATPSPGLMERRIRLRRSKDVERVRKEGQAWHHPLLVLLAAPNAEGRTRIGVLAGRRVGKAVARNRARRLLREAARRLYPHLAPGWDLLLIARPPIVEVKEPQVEEALGQLAREAGLLVGKET
ncbi:MAG: ribonuclease P protein component [Anaerolineae bacterium]|nr:ribonuclease P protein component [Anaerolineae bacterium]MCX8067796.1 ribonuclease P protein component [Anaerolineae bacterium]MDW7990990.1 ribonuclease P protein component [Anaerolineae bacterium]